MPDSPPELSSSARAERRISRATLILGILAALPTGYFYSWLWGAGVLIGALLSWLSFHWLKQGMDALLAAASAQADQQKVHVPVGTYFKAAFRYALIALGVYVIFRYLHVPVLSMVFGLCALGTAAFAVSVHEILHPPD